MRYTKYNYKKKKNNNTAKFIGSMLGGILGACAMGLAVAWVIWSILPVNDSKPASNLNNENQSQISDENQNNGSIVEKQEDKSEFYFVQCGYFSKKDNAQQIMNKITSEKGAFIAEESEKFRVFAGMYTEESVHSKIEELIANGIESVKVTVELDVNDSVEAQVAAICDGYLKILNTTFQDDVKSVKTNEFKGWVESLDTVSEGNNVEELQSLKEYIVSLPDEISKEEVSKEISYLYDYLLIFK